MRSVCDREWRAALNYESGSISTNGTTLIIHDSEGTFLLCVKDGGAVNRAVARRPQSVNTGRTNRCARTRQMDLQKNRSKLACALVLISGVLPLAALCPAPAAAAPATETAVWFNQPAQRFSESCPLGNGRLGAMLFGGINEERIVLNETSMWSGSRQDADRTNAASVLPEIRRLLLEGKNVEAERLVNANFTCQGAGSGSGNGARVPYGSYQVLGNLRLTFPSRTNAAVSNYRRSLDLAQAVARVQFTQDGVTFTREAFASAPAEAIVLRLSADQPGAIDLDARLDRPERFETVASGLNGLLMTGQLENGVDGKGVRYATRLHALNQGGEAKIEGNTLQIRKADSVVLLLTAATDFRGFAGRNLSDPLQASEDDFKKAASQPYDQLLRNHVADYRKYFDRVQFQLGPFPARPGERPTPERIQAVKQGEKDLSLPVLYFNFGRYLLISSSRPGGLPASLQGLWAEEIRTPWNSDWHLDVNVQMNYWPAEVCNLSELAEPLFALIGSLVEPGTKTARAYYGARGWVAHVITNPWGFTSPGEQASWGATTSGSAWLCQHLWDHYLFTRDRKFLASVYPILKGSALFYADMLIEEPKHQWLVTAPANSPENAFRLPDGRQAHVCMGPAVDMQLLRYLFGACIESAGILGLDEDFRKELTEKRARLAPTQIGPDGRLMEWLEPYPEPEPTHRHISHLWAVYPGNEITPEGTPDLAKAARLSLDRRGDRSTGWATAYRLAAWARLGDGNRAHKLLTDLFANCTLPNLFDTHPPFQIDGNFGATAAIAEMLVQSHDGNIGLLPALPTAWPDGRIAGLRARGGITVDVEWKDGRLTAAELRSDTAQSCRLRYGSAAKTVELKPGDAFHCDSLYFN
jgi:alpha-L-fucosidase 2